MLTARENMLETIRGGCPDRFVNQYEALRLLPNPFMLNSPPRPTKGGAEVVNPWGVTSAWPVTSPAAFPVHTPDKLVISDIENWRESLHAPSLKFSQDDWDRAKALYEEVDAKKAIRAAFVAPGLFEQVHNFCSMSDALAYYLTNPEEVHDLIKYLTDWELELAEGICKHLKPDAVFHHDDWGHEQNSFLRPTLFGDFFIEPYKEIYGYYHSHGVELVIHHSDSYAANLVPAMIEMGIDVWQGCMESNDVPALIAKYGGKIAFMGGIDNKAVDFEGWTATDCARAAQRAMDECGGKYFIPCITQGGPGSMYPGAYMALAGEIDKLNSAKFGFSVADIEAQRLPMNVMFGNSASEKNK